MESSKTPDEVKHMETSKTPNEEEPMETSNIPGEDKQGLNASCGGENGAGGDGGDVAGGSGIDYKQKSGYWLMHAGQEQDSSESDIEDYLNAYHSTLPKDDPGYATQRQQRLRNRYYYQLANYLKPNETVLEAIERTLSMQLVSDMKESKGHGIKPKGNNKKETKNFRNRKPTTLKELGVLIKKIEKMPGNEDLDLLDVDLVWLCKTISAPYV